MTGLREDTLHFLLGSMRDAIEHEIDHEVELAANEIRKKVYNKLAAAASEAVNKIQVSINNGPVGDTEVVFRIRR